MYFANGEIATKIEIKSFYILIENMAKLEFLHKEIFTFSHFQICKLEYSLPLYLHKE